ncbi:MAG: 3-isopropylmalate dehydratase large subunit [Rhodoferax sp.]
MNKPSFLDAADLRAESTGLSYFEKVWDEHAIDNVGDGIWLLQVDRLFLHEVTGSVSLRELRRAGHSVDSPMQVSTVIDHVISTRPGRHADEGRDAVASEMIRETSAAARRESIRLIDAADERQGIVHVVSPETGLALPGLTVVCGDSHTCTVGGIGAIGWGIGSSECNHVLATQALLQSKPKTMRIVFDGALNPGVTAKDLALFLIGTHGASLGIGHAVEFSGSAIDAMEIEERLTLCNMGVEFSAKYAFVAPDEKTFAYVKDRQYAPKGDEWLQAVVYWRSLSTDPGARFDVEIRIDCAEIQPQVTWGTSPQHAAAILARIPDPSVMQAADARELAERALSYQGLTAGTALAEVPIDVAYIGSCTNARLSDLRAASTVLKGRKIASGVIGICVPGSSAVRRQAESEGIDRIFIEAGFEWLESGCAMCASGGANQLAGKRVISTTNRNFENRQGPGTRTHLASPVTVAASAIHGRITAAVGLD